MFVSGILNSKVINNDNEGLGYIFVGPESWGEFFRFRFAPLQLIFKYIV